MYLNHLTGPEDAQNNLDKFKYKISRSVLTNLFYGLTIVIRLK